MHHQDVLGAAVEAAIEVDAAQMARHGKSISRTALRPGDLVFFTTSRRRNSHVGIYVGGGSFVHAPHTGDVVKVTSLGEYSMSRARRI